MPRYCPPAWRDTYTRFNENITSSMVMRELGPCVRVGVLLARRDYESASGKVVVLSIEVFDVVADGSAIVSRLLGMSDDYRLAHERGCTVTFQQPRRLMSLEDGRIVVFDCTAVNQILWFLSPLLNETMRTSGMEYGTSRLFGGFCVVSRGDDSRLGMPVRQQFVADRIFVEFERSLSDCGYSQWGTHARAQNDAVHPDLMGDEDRATYAYDFGREGAELSEDEVAKMRSMTLVSACSR